MKLNFIGVAQGLIAVENTEKTWVQRIYENGELVPLGGLVFTLAVTPRGGEPQFYALEVLEDAVLWRLPALAAGDYEYELFVQDDAGSRERMFYGHLEVVPSAAVQQVAELEGVPELETFLGGNGRLRWQWAAGNAAAFYAGRAREAAQDARAAEAEVKDAVEAVPELRRFIETFRHEVSAAIRIVDGVWVVGDRVTGYPAQGPRGMNADEIQYHMIDNVAQLPTDAEHCTPNHRYVVRGRAAVAATGWVDFVMSPAGAGDLLWLYINGAPVIVESPDGSVEQWANVINANRRVFGVVATADGEYLRLTAATPGAAGNLITLYARDEQGASYMPTSGDTLQGGVNEVLDEQYLWIEGAWRLVPLNAPQEATDEVYGLMRFGKADTIPAEFALRSGRAVDGAAAVDARDIPYPQATKETAGVLRRAAALAVGDDGAASGAQVAQALAGKQDTLHFEDPDSEVSRAIAAAVNAAVEAAVSALPLPRVGDVRITFSPLAPDGYVPMEGQRGLSRVGQFAALFAYFRDNGVVSADGRAVEDSGDGATTFDMPDISGCFMRFIGSGRALDPNRKAGSFQAAAVPNINGTVSVDCLTGPAASSSLNATGPFEVYQSGARLYATGAVGKGFGLRFNAAKVSSVYKNGVTEARPANMGLYAYVKY